MRRFLHQSSQGNGSRAIDEAPLESNFEQRHVEHQRRQQFKRVLTFGFLLVMAYLPYLSWRNLHASIGQHPTFDKALIFPLYAHITFDNVSQFGQHDTIVSTGSKLLGRRIMTLSDTYYAQLRRLHNIAFFAEMHVYSKKYFMLIDTASDVSWLFCEPPFAVSKDKLTFMGPNGCYQPSSKNLILYKDLHPPGFYKCGQDGYLCKDIYYHDGMGVKMLMAKDFFVMLEKDRRLTVLGALVFGCAYSFAGPIDVIKNGVDGILGLVPMPFSLTHQLALAHDIRRVVGLCLHKNSNYQPQGVVGYLFFGEEVILVQEQMTWIEMFNDGIAKSFATVLLKNIQIGTFNYEFGGETNAKMIFDTGSTMTYLVPDAYDGLIQYLHEHAISMGYTYLCEDTAKILSENGNLIQSLLAMGKACWFRDYYDTNAKWFKDFENLTFTFQNVDGNDLAQYQLEPTQFLDAYNILHTNLKIGILCSWFIKQTATHSQAFNILGGFAFQGHLVAFDMDNRKIGWTVPKDCEL